MAGELGDRVLPVSVRVVGHDEDGPGFGREVADEVLSASVLSETQGRGVSRSQRVVGLDPKSYGPIGDGLS